MSLFQTHPERGSRGTFEKPHPPDQESTIYQGLNALIRSFKVIKDVKELKELIKYMIFLKNNKGKTMRVNIDIKEGVDNLKDALRQTKILEKQLSSVISKYNISIDDISKDYGSLPEQMKQCREYTEEGIQKLRETAIKVFYSGCKIISDIIGDYTYSVLNSAEEDIPKAINSLDKNRLENAQKRVEQVYKKILIPLRECVAPCRRLTELSGSHLFCYYPNVDGKKILLLGESHSLEGLCKNTDYTEEDIKGGKYAIQDWLYDLSLNMPSDKCLDLFIEEDYRCKGVRSPEEIIYENCPLTFIRNKFRKLENNFPANLRYHYVDTREIIESSVPSGFATKTYSNTMTKWIPMLLQYYQYHKEENWLENETLDIRREDKGEIIRFILGEEQYIQKYIDYMNLFKRIIINNYIKETTNKQLVYDYNNDLDYAKKYTKLLRKEINKIRETEERKKFVNSLIETALDKNVVDIMFTLPMDAYTLARMFLTFDQNKMARGPIGCRDTTSPKNIIFHGGKAHTDFYMKFIKKYKGAEPYINIREPTKCIRFESPFDFWEEKREEKREEIIDPDNIDISI